MSWFFLGRSLQATTSLDFFSVDLIDVTLDVEIGSPLEGGFTAGWASSMASWVPRSRLASSPGASS